MNQLITLVTLRTPRRLFIMALMVCSLIVVGVLPCPAHLILTAAFGAAVSCRDDGSGCLEPIFVLPQPDMAGFDRELFASNGSNTSDVFEAGNYLQAAFRL